MVFAFLKSGFKHMLRNLRVLIIFYLFNFCCALLITIPFRSSLQNFVGKSQVNDILAGELNLDFLMEFFFANPNLSSVLLMMLVVLGSIYILGNLFLSGGAYRLFVYQTGYASVSFWSGGASYFGRFVRLLLWMIPIALIFIGGVPVFFSVITDLVFGQDISANIDYWAKWLRVGIRFFCIVLCYMLFDYGRIYIVQTNERSTLTALGQAALLVFKNIRRTFTLAFTVWLLGMLGLMLYNFLSGYLTAPTSVFVFTMFVLQQMYMIGRTALRLTLFASEVNLFKTLFYSE